MSALSNALTDLEERLESYNQGQQTQPAEQSQEWFELRGLTIARAYLQRVVMLEIEGDPAACERLYRKCLGVFKQAEVPPEERIARELLPSGALPTGFL